MTDLATKPLAGVRVLELARILAGPWSGQLLADLGAEVIKVERPEVGDDTRSWGPPFIKTAAGEAWGSAYYHCCNRGKRSLAVDFQTEDGREIIRKLAMDCDIVIENFKVGGLVKFGLDHESLLKLNPRLVYCSISGFGQTGPYADRAGYDYIIQGMAGIMDVTGEPGREPQKVGVAVVDILTGVYATVGMLAALRRRDMTGVGGHVDMSLMDTATSLLANQAMNYLASGISPTRLGNSHPNIAPYQVFPVLDGHVIIAVGNDRQFQGLCAMLNAPDIGADAEFQTNGSRVAHRARLTQALTERLATFTRAQILDALEKAGVPAGPINRIEDVFADPQVIHRGMRLDLVAGDGSRVAGVASPIVLDGVRMTSLRPSPMLGDAKDL